MLHFCCFIWKWDVHHGDNKWKIWIRKNALAPSKSRWIWGEENNDVWFLMRFSHFFNKYFNRICHWIRLEFNHCLFPRRSPIQQHIFYNDSISTLFHSMRSELIFKYIISNFGYNYRSKIRGHELRSLCVDTISPESETGRAESSLSTKSLVLNCYR